VEQDDRFAALKRRFFLIMLPIASVAVAADLVLHPSPTGVSITAWLGTLLPAGLALLLWRRRRSIRFVESASVMWVLSMLLSILYTTLFRESGREALDQFVAFSPWFSVSLIAVFLIFEPRRATWISSGVYLVTLAFGLAYMIISRVAGAQPMLVRPLIHLYLANAALITFLFVYGRMREQYERTQTLARSMADLANTDPLLGIPNRRQMFGMIRDQIYLAEGGVRPAILVMFDLDRFKQVNDTFGHEAGDNVLKAVTRAIQQVLRSTDRFGRWGGDEFMVLVNVGDMNQAYHAAQRLRDAVHQRLGDRFRMVTISVGVAPYHRGDTVEDWVARADQALYRAKEAGRDRVMVGG